MRQHTILFEDKKEIRCAYTEVVTEYDGQVFEEEITLLKDEKGIVFAIKTFNKDIAENFESNEVNIQYADEEKGFKDYVYNDGKSKNYDVFIEGVIGWDVYSDWFIEDFNKIPKDANIRVFINSVGGVVGDGVAIYNFLNQKYKDGIRFEKFVLSQAYSIASLIMLAGGTKPIIPSTARVMIHEARSGDFYLTAEEHQKEIDKLTKLNDLMATEYSKVTGKTKEYFTQKMSIETYYTGSEAVVEGFAVSEDEEYRLPMVAMDKSEYHKLLTKTNFFNKEKPKLTKELEVQPKTKKEENKKENKEETTKEITNDVVNIEEIKKQERERITALGNLKEQFKGNDEAIKIIEDAIDSGKDESEIALDILKVVKSSEKKEENKETNSGKERLEDGVSSEEDVNDIETEEQNKTEEAKQDQSDVEYLKSIGRIKS